MFTGIVNDNIILGHEFTGIVKEIGRVERITKVGSLIKLGIKSIDVIKDAKVSDSVSVDGVCLTLTHKEKELLSFEAVSSTLKNTNLKRLKRGDFINLEPALSVGDKIGGHFVLGHVDLETKLRKTINRGSHWQLEIDLSSQFQKSIVENGSVTVEGISLTVKKVLPRTFTVDIVPFTYNNTSLKYKKIGNWLNIEFDYLLKQKA